MNFARSGDPNGTASNPELLNWPPYQPGTDRWLVLNRQDRVEPVLLGAKLNFLSQRHARRTAP